MDLWQCLEQKHGRAAWHYSCSIVFRKCWNASGDGGGVGLWAGIEGGRFLKALKRWEGKPRPCARRERWARADVRQLTALSPGRCLCWLGPGEGALSAVHQRRAVHPLQQAGRWLPPGEPACARRRGEACWGLQASGDASASADCFLSRRAARRRHAEHITGASRPALSTARFASSTGAALAPRGPASPLCGSSRSARASAAARRARRARRAAVTVVSVARARASSAARTSSNQGCARAARQEGRREGSKRSSWDSRSRPGASS